MEISRSKAKQERKGIEIELELCDGSGRYLNIEDFYVPLSRFKKLKKMAQKQHDSSYAYYLEVKKDSYNNSHSPPDFKLGLDEQAGKQIRDLMNLSRSKTNEEEKESKARLKKIRRDSGTKMSDLIKGLMKS